MIGHSWWKLLAVRFLIFGFQCVTPAFVVLFFIFVFRSVLDLKSIPLLSKMLDPPIWLWILLIWSGLEVAFLFFIYFKRFPFIQRDFLPPNSTEASRRELFHRSLLNGGDTREYWEGWFLGAKLEEIREGNVEEWLTWSLFNMDTSDFQSHPQYAKMKEEMKGYIRYLESFMGVKFDSGFNDKIKSMRLNLDPVVIRHRPLILYVVIGIMDGMSQLGLRKRKFKRYIQPNPIYRPFLPFDIFSAEGSSNSKISFWHKSPDNPNSKSKPILFIHGIGTGLHTYHWILQEVVDKNPNSDIFLVELMHVSMRFVDKIPNMEETLEGIEKMLSRWNHSQAIVVGHSLGTVVAAWIAKYKPHLISHLVLADPVCIMLHLPYISYNFVYRQPKRANEWLLWWFTSKESGIAWSLGKSFIWSENILWQDQIPDVEKTVIFLAEKDIIVPSKEVFTYLMGKGQSPKRVEEEEVTQLSTKEGVKIHWAWDIDHAVCIFKHKGLIIKTITSMANEF